MLQNIFYSFGIFFMILYTLILVGILVAVLMVKKKVDEATLEVKGKVKAAKELVDHPKEAAVGFGMALAETAYHTIEGWQKHKKR